MRKESKQKKQVVKKKNIKKKVVPQKKYEQVYGEGNGPFIEGYADEWSIF